MKGSLSWMISAPVSTTTFFATAPDDPTTAVPELIYASVPATGTPAPQFPATNQLFETAPVQVASCARGGVALANTSPSAISDVAANSLRRVEALTHRPGRSSFMPMPERALRPGHRWPFATLVKIAIACRPCTPPCCGYRARRRSRNWRHVPNAVISSQTLLGVSRSTLYRLFEPSGGVAASIRNRRHHRLCVALANATDHRRTAERAHACGFTDQTQLTRIFRRAHGMTPLEYRAAMLDAENRNAV